MLFPAYAGVIPVMTLETGHYDTFPRLRGGDPIPRFVAGAQDNFSPPTRG